MSANWHAPPDLLSASEGHSQLRILTASVGPLQSKSPRLKWKPQKQKETKPKYARSSSICATLRYPRLTSSGTWGTRSGPPPCPAPLPHPRGWCAAATLCPPLGGGFTCRCACLPHEPLGNPDPVSRISASQGPTGVWPIADPLHCCKVQVENTWPVWPPQSPLALSHPLCPATSPHQANQLISAAGATGEPRQRAQGKLWNVSSQFTCMIFSEVILSHHLLKNLSI